MSRAARLLAVLVWTGACGPQTEPAPGPPPEGPAESRESVVSEWPLPAFDPTSGPPGPLEREMTAEAVHRYSVDLAAGDYLEVAVEQHRVDVEVDLLDPSGEPVLELPADSPTNGAGTERLGALAVSPGRHVVEVRPFGGIDSAGRYTLRLVALRSAEELDRRRAAAFAALARGQALRRRGPDAGEAALGALGEALALWTRLGDPRGRGIVLYEIGHLQRHTTGSQEATIGAWERAAVLLREAGEPAYEGEVHHLLGNLRYGRGELRHALASYRTALDRRRTGGDRIGETELWNQVGLVRFRLRQPAAALRCYDRAIARWRELGAPVLAAAALNNRAWVHLDLGRLREAERDFSRARTLWEETGDPRRAAEALLGTAHVAKERARDPAALRSTELREAALGQALDRYRRALAVFESPDGGFDPFGQGVALGGIGGTLARLGQWRESREALDASLALFHELGEAREAGQIHLDLAEWAARRGDHDRTRRSVRRALPLLERAGDDDGRAAALSWRAEADRAEGRLVEAAEALEEAVGIVEDLRAAAPPGGTFRASFLATKQNYFEEYVDLLMERHALDPAEGFDARALEVHERSRARSLLDGAAGGGGRAALGRTLGVAEIRGLLDERTVLLEYHLGPRRSFAWTIERGRLESFVLPRGPEIEALALDGHRLLSSPPARKEERRTEEVLARASAILLAPLAGRDGPDRRLVIVAHGALQYLPFAALPVPTGGRPAQEDTSGPERLVDRYELAHLPSASLLAALRERDRDRPPVLGRIAVLADPVYGPDDPRVAGGARPVRTGSGSPAPRGGGEEYPRLERTLEEAEAILRLVPPEESFAAVGFEATEDLLTGGLPGGFRILHLATHGEIDASGGGRSRLIFSRVDADGRPRNGTLYADQLYGLDLPCDLVVLSACRTALGEEIRGEGLVGLAHGFFHAGGSRLVVSLWSVDDAATSELMTLFYRELLAGAGPAAALRAAQRGVRREPAWRAPYYWAPFVLEGDWRWRPL